MNYVYYFAIGERYLAVARISAASVRSGGSSVPGNIVFEPGEGLREPFL